MIHSHLSKKNALRFIVMLGFVSLFADITYEGARSISGQFLAILGASGAVVGFVAGFGEMIGYAFRLLFGYISDRTGKYWLFTFIGYAINLFAVPLLALAGNWQLAAGLLILERFGKAIRSPSKDAMLSFASKSVGRGWGFGLHEAMDQIGAILGPLLMSCVLYFQGSYQMGFALLLIPAFFAMCILAVAWILFPKPQELEAINPNIAVSGFAKQYWLYIAAICCVAAGYVDFSLIAFHFEKIAIIPQAWIPIFFSAAMGAAGLAALLLGRLFDKYGIAVLIFVTAGSSLFAPLVFINKFYFAFAGTVLWGIGLGAQESIMRAVVADLVQPNLRGTAYGLFNLWFGLCWFIGSATMGVLYDISVLYLVAFSLALQLCAIPILLAVKHHTY